MRFQRAKSHLAYKFDNIMSKGIASLIGLLAVASLVFIALISAVVVIFELYPPGNSLGFAEVFWGALLRTLDPGTMGQDSGLGFRGAMLAVTLSGIILVASLIGVISTAFNSKVEQLRKGRSRVIETEHTVILGWNSKVFHILHEICIANESRKSPAIVILADRDKVGMEDEIHSRLKNVGKTRIVVRSGDPMSLIDLELTSHRDARSVVILAQDDRENSDSITIKTALALVNSPKRKSGKYHIVGEIIDPANLEAANLVGGDEAHWVLGQELISRLIVQTSRQSGLSSVFTELLDFEDSEFYLLNAPELVGCSYGELVLRFSQGCLLGVISGDEVQLNPAIERIYQNGELLLLVALDDSQISIAPTAEVDSTAILSSKRPSRAPEKTLVLGTSPTLESILREMSAYVAASSQVVIVDDHVQLEVENFENMSVVAVQADPTSRKTLEDLDVAGFDHIVVLADRARFGIQHSDARTLMSLLHLRELAKKAGASLNIVSEMLDDHNRELAESTDADDFIVSDKLVSLMLAQLEENAELAHVFSALLSSEGSEVRLHPVEWYVRLGVPVDFNTLVAAAIGQGDSAIGLNLPNAKEHSGAHYGVRLNPSRTEKLVFQEGDKVVVLTNE